MRKNELIPLRVHPETYSNTHKEALKQALERARLFRGATAPNPPVGAAGLDAEGRILSVQAHERAGTGHAEAKVIADLRERGLIDQLHTLVITLEPCNHHGRTPPCTEAILASSAQKILYGVPDPNPRVPGGGGRRLRDAGREVYCLNDPECAELLEPFSKWIRTGLPYVTVKTAWSAQGSMIPPPGQKTFTSEESLRLAHELRKESDAILTGSGTVLSDDPAFTVRRVPDHPGKSRWLAIMDRRSRVPEAWLQSRKNLGFHPLRWTGGIRELLEHLGSKGVLHVLVEAGPELSSAIISSDLWDRHVVITQVKGQPDQIEVRKK